MASITVVSGPNEGDYYPIGKRTLVVGRDEGVPIQLDDELVSRKHLQFRFDDGNDAYFAFDMQSANGTLVNGRQLEGDLKLSDGDTIELGNSRLMFSKQDFADRESALNHYHRRGERGKSTILRS